MESMLPGQSYYLIRIVICDQEVSPYGLAKSKQFFVVKIAMLVESAYLPSFHRQYKVDL